MGCVTTRTYREGGILDGYGHVGPEQRLRAEGREEEDEILSKQTGIEHACVDYS